jgi:Uma2 family endonuclease
MTTATLTPADLLVLPDDGRVYELLNGEPVEKTASTESSRLGARATSALMIYADTTASGWTFGPDTGFRCFSDTDDPDRVRKPDAAFVSLERMPVEDYVPDGYCTVVPDLVVEVISPNDLATNLEAKRDEWLNAGVRSVWIVDPDAKTVRIHRADGSVGFLRERDVLSDETVLPGFALPVADLFRKPGQRG